MANTTSGTATFGKNFSIDEIIEEAYERCGVRGVAGYQLKTARRSLNILFQEWSNRGLHFWEVAETNVTLVAAQAIYTLYRSSSDGTSDAGINNAGGAESIYGAEDILQMSYRTSQGTTSQADTPLTKIDRAGYAANTNRLAQGQPSEYWVQRFIDKVTITLYITPSSTQAGNYIHFWYLNRIQDTGDFFNAADVPYNYIPAMCSGLAYYLSLKYAPERTDPLKLLYEDELVRAEAADGSSASTFITPKTYYPNI